MATITGLTAAQMLLLADDNINGGTVNNLGNLVLTTRGGKSIDAGPIIATGPNNQFYRGDKTWAAISKSDVGLSNVENVAASSLYVPKWQPNTAYALGQQVVLPTNDIGIPKAAFTTGAIFDASKWTFINESALPKGIVFSNDVFASSGPATALVVVNNIASFTFLANRWYEVEWTTAVINNTGANPNVLAQIYTCSTNDSAGSTTGMTEIAGYNVAFSQANQTVRADPKRKIKYATDTTLQIKATLSGNGSSVFSGAGPTWPAQFTIEDLGMTV